MSTPATLPAQTLFLQWRRGDAASGRLMAQRFTDWYLAICVARLGEHDGKDAARAVCGAFQQGIGKVASPAQLIPWAHGLAKREFEGRSIAHTSSAPRPGAFTKGQAPGEILARARKVHPAETALLEAFYSGQASTEDPSTLLAARATLKDWIQQEVQVSFRASHADPDLLPLAHYEAHSLHTEADRDAVETWILDEPELSRELVEFAQFALALRRGIPKEAPTPVAAEPAPASQAPTPAPVPASQAPTPAPVAAAPRPRVHSPQASDEPPARRLPVAGIAAFVVAAAALAYWILS